PPPTTQHRPPPEVAACHLICRPSAQENVSSIPKIEPDGLPPEFPVIAYTKKLKDRKTGVVDHKLRGWRLCNCG
ncbi:hypothetical protein Pfo_020431, partial [Paulownia fortunei]